MWLFVLCIRTKKKRRLVKKGKAKDVADDASDDDDHDQTTVEKVAMQLMAPVALLKVRGHQKLTYTFYPFS